MVSSQVRYTLRRARPNVRIGSAIATEDGKPVEEWLSFTMSPSRLLVTLAPRAWPRR